MLFSKSSERGDAVGDGNSSNGGGDWPNSGSVDLLDSIDILRLSLSDIESDVDGTDEL